MAENCPNCSVELSETPEEDGLHPVQMATPVEGGEVYCEACVFGGSGAEESEGQYENPGDVIVAAAEVDADDEELVRMLEAAMTVPELRRFMSTFGMSRTRGASKHESAAPPSPSLIV